MLKFKETPLYRALYQLHLYMDKVLMAFPKKYYYSIGQLIRKQNIKILRLTHKAVITQGKKRKKCLRKVNAKIEVLKLYLKMCFEYKILSLKKISYIFFNLNTIQNQVYSWYSSLK